MAPVQQFDAAAQRPQRPGLQRHVQPRQHLRQRRPPARLLDGRPRAARQRPARRCSASTTSPTPASVITTRTRAASRRTATSPGRAVPAPASMPASRKTATATSRRMSGFVQNQFDFGRWTVTPGLRFEHVDYERINNLTGEAGNSTVEEWIPGLGTTFEAAPGTVLVRRRPPRVRASGSRRHRLGERRQCRPRRRTLLELRDSACAAPSATTSAMRRRCSAWTSRTRSFLPAWRAAPAQRSRAPARRCSRASNSPDASRARHSSSGPSKCSPTPRTPGWRMPNMSARDYSNVPGNSTVSVTGNRLPYAPEHLFSGHGRRPHDVRPGSGPRGRLHERVIHRRPQHRGGDGGRPARRDAWLHRLEPDRQLRARGLRVHGLR